MTTGTWLSAGLLFGGGSVYVAAGGLRRDWHGRGRVSYTPVSGSFILTVGYHAFVRTGVFAGLGIASLAGLAMLTQLGVAVDVLPDWSDLTSPILSVLWACVLLLLILSNRPRSLVPPYLRDKPGAVIETLELLRDSRNNGDQQS